MGPDDGQQVHQPGGEVPAIELHMPPIKKLGVAALVWLQLNEESLFEVAGS